MDSNQEKNGFTYTYSAKEQAELKRIREKYTPPTEEEDKMARLRRLDESVTVTALTVALVLGIVGTLNLGFGMSLIMTDISALLGSYKDYALVIGIIIGVLGGIIAGIAYPVYNFIVKAKRKAVAPEIIRLTNELMK